MASQNYDIQIRAIAQRLEGLKKAQREIAQLGDRGAQAYDRRARQLELLARKD